MAKLKPKEKAYYGHFSAAAHAAHAAAVELAELSGSSVGPAERAAAAERLAALAEVGASEYRAVLLALRASFVTPFERTEIQALSRSLAQVAGHLEAAGALVHLLDPADLTVEFGALTDLLCQAGAATEEAVGKLHKLKGIKHHHEKIEQIAAEAEFHRRLLLVRLTSGEIDPLDAIELHAISGELAAAVGAFVVVAEAVETVLITEG
jgi:uncharacterized protein Yka (UPF0111/DUF47 family)